MRAPGILGMVQLGVTLAFALPIALFGLSWLLDGRPAGALFVALGAVMILLERALTNPFDPVDVAESAVDRVRGKE